MIRRRTFLKLVGGVATAGACSSGGVAAENVGKVGAGIASAISPDSLTIVPGDPVCVGRDGVGIYAMTLICTHQGCDMGQEGSVSWQGGLLCQCHGSRFDVDGNVVGGPASAPLAHFAVSTDASGSLIVDTGTEVDAATRLVVG